MKKLVIVVVSFCELIISCSNLSGSTSTSAKDNSSTDASSNTVNSGSKRIITCNMDSEVKTFHVSQAFFEIPLDVDRTGPKNGIEILDGDSKKEGFQFQFKNSGTTRIKKDAPGDLFCSINYYNRFKNVIK